MRPLKYTLLSTLSMHAKMHNVLTKKHHSKKDVMQRLEHDIALTMEKIEEKEQKNDSTKLSSLKELAKELQAEFAHLKKRR